MAEARTRRQLIDDKPLFVVDGLVADTVIHSMDDALRRAAFVRQETAGPDTLDFRHWSLNVPREEFETLPIYQPTLAVVQKLVDQPRYRIFRAYCNNVSYGDMLHTHTDCLPQRHELTAMWYICKSWNRNWYGETVFYNKDDDAVAVVSPRPGRLAVFHGAIAHAGRPPSKICMEPRFTFAFKLEPV